MKQVVIYDDLYSDPLTFRNTILGLEFEQTSSGNYPGKNSFFTWMPDDLISLMSHLTGESLKPAEGSHCGGFRIQNMNDVGRQFIHVDIPNPRATWAGVCYLSLPGDYTNEDGSFKDAGTKLWKHKETGMESLPYDTDYLESIGIKGWDDLKLFMDTQGIDESKWINTMTIPIKFNRLVLFRSNLWHSQGELFGNSLHNGRLIQMFFFEPNNDMSDNDKT